MSAKIQLGDEIKLLGHAKVGITDATTTSFDFGTPGDLYLPDNDNGASYASGDRIVIVFTSTRVSGDTSVITFVVNDAPDSSGSIGSTAAALTDGDALDALAEVDGVVVVGVELQAGRPWLQCRVTSDDATDDVVCTATVLAIPASL